MAISDELTDDEQIADLVAECYADPLRHVLISYPWGEPGTQLADFEQPFDWQIAYLMRLAEEIRERKFDGHTTVDPIQMSTMSGHGIGKSALVAWLIRWVMDTRPFCKGTVTATTANQLRTKTWAELAKWHHMAMTQHWYTLNTSAHLNYYNKAHPATWRFDAQTCEEHNSEAFAGQHTAGSTSCYIFDEAAGVPDKIWEVREGGLVRGEPFTFDFGNGTKNTGKFAESHRGKGRDRYIRYSIDSRDVPGTNLALFKRWAEEYGEDSDFFKVRVRGMLPSASSLQLIPLEWVERCMSLDVNVYSHDALVMGVDVARFGDNKSVIYLRRGRDAATDGFFTYIGIDTQHLAAEVARIAAETKPNAIFIDGAGVGGGVVDACRALGLEVIEINGGERATQRGYYNLRAQCWGNMKDAIKAGIALPEDNDLRNDLIGLEYGYTLKNLLKLETKEDAAKRGIASPDIADALSLTYAFPVAPTRDGWAGDETTTQSDYDPYN